MDKKLEIIDMVEEIYVNCILDYLYVLVRDAHQVALTAQTTGDSLADTGLNEKVAERVPED